MHLINDTDKIERNKEFIKEAKLNRKGTETEKVVTSPEVEMVSTSQLKQVSGKRYGRLGSREQKTTNKIGYGRFLQFAGVNMFIVIFSSIVCFICAATTFSSNTPLDKLVVLSAM